MTEQTKAVIRQALQQYRGDNLERARAAFRGLSPDVLQQDYGASGQTCQQILDDAQAHVDAVTRALRDVESAVSQREALLTLRQWPVALRADDPAVTEPAVLLSDVLQLLESTLAAPYGHQRGGIMLDDPLRAVTRDLVDVLVRVRDLPIECSQAEDRAAWEAAHTMIARAETVLCTVKSEPQQSVGWPTFTLSDLRQFISFLSGDVPELHRVEVPRLAESLERFLAHAQAGRPPEAELWTHEPGGPVDALSPVRR